MLINVHSWDKISHECSTQLVTIMGFSGDFPLAGSKSCSLSWCIWCCNPWSCLGFFFPPDLDRFLSCILWPLCAKGTSMCITRARPACSSLFSSSWHSELWAPATWSSLELLNPESLLAFPESLPCVMTWALTPGSKLEKSGGLLCFSPPLRCPCPYLMSSLVETRCHISYPLFKPFFKWDSLCHSIPHL